MPRFKNAHPLGWDVDVFDGTRRIEVPYGEEFEVTADEAKNPLFTDTDVFEKVAAKSKAKAGEDDK
jgi:hypothetical protein